MDPLGIIGNGQAYSVQQRQASAASAADAAERTSDVKKTAAASGQSVADPQGIQLPEDKVTLSGQRPQIAAGSQADKTDPLAGRKAEQQDTAEDKATVSGKSTEDPQVKQQIDRLKAIEEKVKAHEAAHKSAGGGLAGSVSYSYTQGPDGRSYITGGEVQIDMSGGRTPQETIAKMQQVIRAALAPADPSGQDRAVASQAASQMATAQQQKLQADSPSAEPKPGEQVDPAAEAIRQAVKPEDPRDGSEEKRAASSDPLTAERRSVTTPLQAGADLVNQVQRAYTEPSVQGNAAGNRASSTDAATVMGLFNQQSPMVSSYA